MSERRWMDYLVHMIEAAKLIEVYLCNNGVRLIYDDILNFLWPPLERGNFCAPLQNGFDFMH